MKTVVTVTSTGFDERPGAEAEDIGCGTGGCVPELARDGILDIMESRWSCKGDIVEPGEDICKIEFVFEEDQDIDQLQVAFFRGDLRSRTLKVFCRASKINIVREGVGKRYSAAKLGTYCMLCQGHLEGTVAPCRTLVLQSYYQ